MIESQAIKKIPESLQIPLWRRLILVTALFLTTGPLALMTLSQAAYASPILQAVYASSSHHSHNSHGHSSHGNQKKQTHTTIINGPITIIKGPVYICITGRGGNGGVAKPGAGSGAGGGAGGDCIIHSKKGETGGSFSGSSGGNISLGR